MGKSILKFTGLIFLTIIMALLAGCGENTAVPATATPAPTTVTTTAPATSATTSGVTTTAPATTPPAVTTTLSGGFKPVTTPGGENVTNTPDPESRARDAVQADLVKNFNVSPANIELISSVPRDWSDSSLGCPKPDEFYLQVITPGFQIMVRDRATNTRYDYHTDQKGRVVMCSKQ